jgi:lipoyl(octanoyl) transferase
MPSEARVYRLGSVRYQDAHVLQERLQLARQRGLVPDTILMLEHPPAITLGRGAKEENLRFPREGLRARGIDVHEVGRGGDVTYHGPGQLVCYPILELAPDRQDVRRYVKDLEEAMIRLSADHGLVAERIEGLNGTWIRSAELGDRKIGAIGVRISRWVTMHGLAYNVTTNLAHFGLIVPCGIRDKGVTSLALELDAPPPMERVMDELEVHLGALLDRRLLRCEGDPLAGVDLDALDEARASA